MSREEFEVWMNILLEKLNSLETRVDELLSRKHILNGEILLDNQDLCFQLKLSKRSLQRYRSEGKLKYKRLDQKTFYLKTDVEDFIRKNLVEITKDRDNDAPEE